MQEQKHKRSRDCTAGLPLSVLPQEFVLDVLCVACVIAIALWLLFCFCLSLSLLCFDFFLLCFSVPLFFGIAVMCLSLSLSLSLFSLSLIVSSLLFDPVLSDLFLISLQPLPFGKLDSPSIKYKHGSIVAGG